MNECETKQSYCNKLAKCIEDGSFPDKITALAIRTKGNDLRIKLIENLGGPTTLSECDNSREWFLRWWCARYDYYTALDITEECLVRELDFASVASPEEYYFLERSIYNLFGPMANEVGLLKELS